MIRLRDGRGRAVKTRGWGKAPLGDHAYLDGPTELGLRRGDYRFDLDAGPEYRTRAGHFTIERHADDAERVEMQRFANLSEEGWVAADLLSARSIGDLLLLKRATQTTLASRVGFRWRDGAWKPIDRRSDGLGADALWVDPRGVVWLIDPTGALSKGDLPLGEGPSAAMLASARASGWKVMASCTSWELPVWLAHGLVDGLVVVDGWADSAEGKRATAAGYVGDSRRFAGRRGAGRWRERVYHQALDAGLRVPPVAGSGSGLNDTPFAAARVYVSATHDADYWERLAAGAAFVTNGPLLRPTVQGEPPGATFAVEPDAPLALEVGLSLATRDAVDYLEILRNGRVEHSVRLAEWAEAGGRLPATEFDASGWLVVRAVTNATDRYQMAMTAPYWVESPAGPRISAGAVAFFTNWLERAAERFAVDRDEAYARARAFWRQRGELASD